MFSKDSQILCVDDAKGMLNWMEATLKSLGFQNIKTTSSGFEALRILKENKTQLLFVDLHMPEKDGLDLIRELKDDPQFSNLPIIVLTADSDTGRIMDAIQLGVSSYILKPATAEIVGKKMSEAYQKSAA